MKKNKRKKSKILFEKFASKSTRFAGSSTAFSIAFLIILIWGATGPVFNYSQTWQIVINTATTIITFLMVFLIQHSQNKDSMSLHLKLDELIAALGKANNRLIDAENLTEEELKVLQRYYRRKGYEFKKSKGIQDSSTNDKSNS